MGRRKNDIVKRKMRGYYPPVHVRGEYDLNQIRPLLKNVREKSEYTVQELADMTGITWRQMQRVISAEKGYETSTCLNAFRGMGYNVRVKVIITTPSEKKPRETSK